MMSSSNWESTYQLNAEPGTSKQEEQEQSTGIIRAEEKTDHQILEGVWLQNDVLAFLTLDVPSNTVCLEVFKFSNTKITQHCKQELFGRGTADAWSMAVDSHRKFLTVFLYRWVSLHQLHVQNQDIKVEQNTGIIGYFINLEELVQSSDLRAQMQQLEPKEFNVARIKKEVKDKHLVDLRQVLVTNTAENNQAEFKLCAIAYTPGNPNVRKSYFEATINTKDNEDITVTYLNREDDPRDVVGFFRIGGSLGALKTLIVYDSCETRLFGKKPKSNHKFQSSCGRIKTAHLTFNKVPLLLVQGDAKEVEMFEYVDSSWKLVRSFELPNYQVQHAFGNFVIASHQQKHNVRLFETNNEAASRISTQLDLCQTGHPSGVDACFDDQMSLLRYSKNEHYFEFTKMAVGRVLFVTEKNLLDQVCDKFLVTLIKKKPKFSSQFIGYLETEFDIQTPFRNSRPLKFPDLNIEIESFTCQLFSFEGTPHILLDIVPKVTQKIQQATQSLVVVNTDTAQVKWFSYSKLPFKKLVFSDEDRIFVQNSRQIVECVLKMENSKFFLIEKGVVVDVGLSRLTLVDLIDDPYKGQHLLLVGDRLVNNVRDRVVYTLFVDRKPNLTADDVMRNPTFILQTEQDNLEDIFSANSCQRVIACWDKNLKKIFAVLAGEDFALLYIMEMSDCPQAVQPSLPVTICKASGIAVVNEQQIVVYSRLNMVIVNFSRTHESVFEKKEMHILSQDFKIQFESPINQVSLSHSSGSGMQNSKQDEKEDKVMAVIFGQHSLLISIGKARQEQFYESLKTQTRRLGQCATEDIRSLNHLAASFRRCLKRFEVDGYITLTQENGQWKESERFTPINVHAADLLCLTGRNKQFVQTILTQHVYLNGFTVWEGIIRDALEKEQIEITDYQVPRFLRPVIGDHNRSLIEHLCTGKSELLKQILDMPGVRHFYSQFQVKSPIFFNFSGMTPLEIALQSRDYESFYTLVELLLEYQNNPINFYLVKHFLIKTIKKGLRVENLFDSNICHYKISSDEFKWSHKYPDFHSNPTKVIKNYPNSFNQLKNDDSWYDSLFGKQFPTAGGSSKSMVNETVHLDRLVMKSRLEEHAAYDQQQPIVYHACQYPLVTLNADDKESLKRHNEEVSSLLEILSVTENTSLFRTAYIQTFIDYQWSGKLKKSYKVVLACYLGSFVLTLCAASCTNDFGGSEPDGDLVRTILMTINAVLVLISVGAFEFRQIVTQGVKYLNSFWNVNDVLVFFLTTIIAILEFLYYTTVEYDLTDETVNDTVSDDGAVSLLRMLAKRRPKGGSSGSVTIDTGDGVVQEIPMDARLKQWIRVAYACLILNGFCKVLNVAQVYKSVGYLVKMLANIARESVPFLTFFGYLNFTFTFMFYVMNITFDETREKTPYGEYQGIDSVWFGPYLLYTFRQSLGDFKTDTFLFLPKPQLYACWVMWLICITINSMIFLNFLIVTIEGVYEDVKATQIEQAYQKKTELLKDLDDVFGIFIDTRPVSVLISREPVQEIERLEISEQVEQIREEIYSQRRNFTAMIAEVKTQTLAEIGKAKQLLNE